MTPQPQPPTSREASPSGETPPTDEPATAARVLAALRTRYDRDKGWATFTEVTTAGTNRRADAMALNVWTNSRDFQLHGFEVKVARNDWLNELRNPGKSEYFRDRCTYWWIAAGPGIVKKEELPPNWGLLILKGGVLVLERQAMQLPQGVGLDRDLLLVLLRHAYDASPSKDALQAERDAGYLDGRRAAERLAESTKKYEAQHLDRDYADYKEMRREFEKASGVHLTAMNAKVAGTAYGLLYRSKDRTADALQAIEGNQRQLQFMVENHQRIVDEARKKLQPEGPR